MESNLKKHETKEDIMKDEIMNFTEACNYGGWKKSTLYSYCHNRLLRYYKLRNRKSYFLKSDLDSFIINVSNLVKTADEIEEEATEFCRKRRKNEK